MCKYNMSINDAVVNEIRPHFKDEESLLMWMEVSMEHLMREYAARFKNRSLGREQSSKSDSPTDRIYDAIERDVKERHTSALMLDQDYAIDVETMRERLHRMVHEVYSMSHGKY